MGEPGLRLIAHELVQVIKSNVSIDWMHRASARANIRRHVKRLLRKCWVSARPSGCGGPERVAASRGFIGGLGYVML
jgi:hypothetical protein